jgi:hypothetical protein
VPKSPCLQSKGKWLKGSIQNSQEWIGYELSTEVEIRKVPLTLTTLKIIIIFKYWQQGFMEAIMVRENLLEAIPTWNPHKSSHRLLLYCFVLEGHIIIFVNTEVSCTLHIQAAYICSV